MNFSDQEMHEMKSKTEAVKFSNSEENDNNDDTYIIVVEQTIENLDEKKSVETELEKKMTVENKEFSKILSPADNAVVCRLCMSENVSDNMISITGETRLRFVDIAIKTALESFTNIIVSDDDDLPKNICGFCLSKLESAWAFRQQCIKSDKIMHDLKWATRQFCELSNSASGLGRSKENDFSDTEAATVDYYGDGSDEEIGDLERIEELPPETDVQKGFRIQIKYEKLKKLRVKTGFHSTRPVRKEPKVISEEGDSSDSMLLHKRPMCGKLDATVVEVNEQKRTEHGDSYPYSCLICNCFFKIESSLSHHVKTAHSINLDYMRNIRCNICSKRVHRNMISNHYLSHKKESDVTDEVLGNTLFIA